jgi:hypothetical protein
MGLFKKNPVFCILFAVCLLLFTAGSYLVVTLFGSLARPQAQVANVKVQLNDALHSDPAPSAENVEASQQNAEQLRAELQKIRDNLQRGSRLTASTGGVRVMAGIQQYISEFQYKAAVHSVEGGESVVIKTPNDFAFGFETYIDKGVVPEDKAAIPVLDKQRQILSYIVNQLIASDPTGIQKVEREVLEFDLSAKGSTANVTSGFQINPAISARVPGAINTLAFRVTFTGYTKSLRQFLNELAEFNLPVVVRSVEVNRPTESATTAIKKAADGLDALFAGFGGSSGSSAKTEASQAEQKPVISENVSSFTIVLEFIEIVLPADSGEAHS